MARKVVSRKEKRAEAEAAEAAAQTKAAAKKTKASQKKASQSKSKSKKNRRRLVWVIFSGAMKEEGRFPYEQREEAEKRLQQLRARGKRLYFLQPIKEPLTGPSPSGVPLPSLAEELPEEEEKEPEEEE